MILFQTEVGSFVHCVKLIFVRQAKIGICLILAHCCLGLGTLDSSHALLYSRNPDWLTLSGRLGSSPALPGAVLQHEGADVCHRECHSKPEATQQGD